MRVHGRPIARLLCALVLFSGCGVDPFAGGSPIPTPCGGSHVWPPNGYGPLPENVIVEKAGPTTIRVRNETGHALAFRTALWTDSPCVGFVADSLAKSLISTGHLVEANFDPHDPTLITKIGVEVYAPECDEACSDPPIGFGWIDIVVPTPS